MHLFGLSEWWKNGPLHGMKFHESRFSISDGLVNTENRELSWCQLCSYRQHRGLSLCRHWRQTLYDDNCQFSSLCQLFGTDGTAGCHKDNHRCHRWRKSWHYDNCQISVGESIDCCPQRFSCLRLWCFVSSAVEQSADQPVDWSLNLDQLPLTWRIEKG